VGAPFSTCAALFGGLARLPPASRELRRELESVRRARAGRRLHAQSGALIRRPRRAFHANDSQRIQRALEVCLNERRGALAAAARRCQRPAAVSRAPLGARFRLSAGLLHAKLEKRFNHMMAHGFFK